MAPIQADFPLVLTFGTTWPSAHPPDHRPATAAPAAGAREDAPNGANLYRSAPPQKPQHQQELSGVAARALQAYEQFYNLPRGTATLDQVASSSAGIAHVHYTRNAAYLVLILDNFDNKYNDITVFPPPQPILIIPPLEFFKKESSLHDCKNLLTGSF